MGNRGTGKSSRYLGYKWERSPIFDWLIMADYVLIFLLCLVLEWAQARDDERCNFVDA